MFAQSVGIEYLSSEHLERLSDEKLIERCRQKDRAAMDVLVKRYERFIFRTAYRLVGNGDDAQDIAAETFLRICRGIGTYRFGTTLPGWIKCIVLNVYRDTYRYARCHPAVSLDAVVEQQGDTVLALETPPKSSPEGQAEEHERNRFVNEAIDGLPNLQRRMISLYYQQHRSYEEIARLMQIPLGTVRSRLNRARHALRDRLASYVSIS